MCEFPLSPHEAGKLIKRAASIFTLPTVTRATVAGGVGACKALGYIETLTMRLIASPFTISRQALASHVALHVASCHGFILYLVTITARTLLLGALHITHAYVTGPPLAALGYVDRGALGIISPACIIGVVIAIASLAQAEGVVGRVCRGSIPPSGQPNPRVRRTQPFMRRENWQSRFAGTRDICYSRLVSRYRNPLWLLALALQWGVVVALDIGDKILNHRVALRSFREDLLLLEEEAPTALSPTAIGRWFLRWANLTYHGARRHLAKRLRTLAYAELALASHLLHESRTRGLAEWLHTWLKHTLDTCAKWAKDAIPVLSNLRTCVYAIAWLWGNNFAHRATRTANAARSGASWVALVFRLAIVMLASRAPHTTRTPLSPLPRAARAHPEGVSMAVAAATAAAAEETHAMHANAHAPPGRVGYALITKPKHSKRSKAVARTSAALISASRTESAFWDTKRAVHKWMYAVIDSGCTWHVQNCLEDLINVTSCSDVIVDANGRKVKCPHRGDLPLLVTDKSGKEYTILLRGVRYSPSFEDTLISVDQLWYASKIDARFRDLRQLSCTKTPQVEGSTLTLPFGRHRGLYMWKVGVLPAPESTTPPATPRVPRGASRGHSVKLGSVRKSGIHAANTHSHVRTLPADDVAAVLHRRLHIGLGLLRRLGGRASDVPSHVASAHNVTCPHCVSANGHKLSQPSSKCHASHAGLLVHADIAGPFKRSWLGGFQYALVLTDDHTRFKFIYFLKAESDAPDRVRRFMASFNAMANLRSDAVVRVVSTLHTDNAGEFLSKQFQELLDDALVAQTTCPPHVHQLNGVAERSILSVWSLARSYFVSSGVGVTFWPFAFQMAVDVLNRTTGPTAEEVDGPSSYELLTGEKPRVMDILPFGCRAFAVKPREQYSKTTIDPRAWVGYNLGRSARSPGAYEVYVPTAGRVVTTSEVYFQESLFPCRPRGEQLDETAPDSPTAQRDLQTRRSRQECRPSPPDSRSRRLELRVRHLERGGRGGHELPTRCPPP